MNILAYGRGMLFCFGLLCMTAAGCGDRKASAAEYCHLVMEEGEGFVVEHLAQTVKRGGDAVFTLYLEDGYEWDEDASSRHASYLVRYENDKKLNVKIKNVQYSEALRAYVKQCDRIITYYANGGIRLDGGQAQAGVEAASVSPDHRLRPNTSIGTELFAKEGFVLTGWNTKPDGSGMDVGLGSRVDFQEGMALYAQWVPWTDPNCFSYTKEREFCVITGYRGKEQTICIPAFLDGYPVRRIAAHAFEKAKGHTVVFPPGIYEIEKWAFRDAVLRELFFYDDLIKVSDYAFEGCTQFASVHINAILEPVYSGSYFDTFQDKYDRLRMLSEKKKIVLFSGSSTRFGYDSAEIDRAFATYEVVNMGVFAYSPALPQLLLILDLMQEGDVLLDAPEFDAANRQFCSQNALDYAVFAMMESNYDTFAKLDIREFSQVFTAYTAYNALRQDMEKKSYRICACEYDEDGNPIEGPSYNAYGDYILYRPNAEEEQPVYGLAVNYTVRAFPKEQYLKPINRIFQRFLHRGVQVFVTYAPRNRYALSKESTKEERARLDAYLKENLMVPVISDLEDSLYSGVYLYGTDNHLSTEGVKLRTKKIIADLSCYIKAGGEK